MFRKLKLWLVGLFLAICAGFSIALSFFNLRLAKKERNALRKTIKKQKKYSKEKEKIEDETNEKLNRLNSDDTSSFGSSIELLHEASNADD